MDEREKIIKTLRASGYGYFVTHEKANADEALNDAADALIAAGIGDICEYKRRVEFLEDLFYIAIVDSAEKELAEEKKDE